MSRCWRLPQPLVGAGGKSGRGWPAARSSDGHGSRSRPAGSGGVYFVYGGGLAKLIGDNLDGYRGHCRGHLGLGRQHVPDRRRQERPRLHPGRHRADAVKGTDTFTASGPGPGPGPALQQPHPGGDGQGQGHRQSVEDLEGKRVSVGSPGSGTEVIALRILEAAGLDPDERHQPPAARASTRRAGAQDGALDAFFWSGGVPTSAVTDLATTRELLLLPTDQYVDELKERYGDFYTAAEIEAGGYEGVEAPVKVVAVPNYLVVNRSMDPELAYQLTKLLFDQKEALVKVHPAARRLELETAPKVAPLELHPGAQRYYDEQAKT